MDKSLNYDFYRVVMEETTTFEQILRSVDALDGASKTFDNGRYDVRLVNLVSRPGYYLGDIARIRMIDIPEKMKLSSGDREPIELDPDEGLGEIASFIYNPALNALMYMRNRFSVTASGFAGYFQNRGNVIGDIILEHILSAEAYHKLATMTVAKKVEVALAAPGNAEIYRDLGLRPQAMQDLMTASAKVKMDFTFSLGHDRGLSLPLGPIRKIVRDLTQSYDEEIIKLQVSGKSDPDQKTELVDLLQEVMAESQTVTLRRGQRTITDDQRHDAIQQAYSRKLPQLSRILNNG